MPAKWTHKFEVKPKSWVFVPSPESLRIGSEIKSLAESVWQPPDFYYHHQSQGHIGALNRHLHHDFFIHLDIKNFFGSINRSRITRAFRRHVGYTRAREVAMLSTVINPESENKNYMLPFGFIQSPILASICLDKSKLGKILRNIERSNSACVSVYVDDIILSMQSLEIAKEILAATKAAAQSSRFEFNTDKEQGPSTTVTAFNIQLSHGKIRITDSRMAMFIETCQTTDNPSVIAGINSYIRSVDPSQVIEYTIT
jgi:Reverse transcriptase (RNA-dependent DNA polymerase)